ncbi:hypothetical protein [Terasakiella pusilla]|uniref:hypothetical protein n=1 Tax=Terasakiella pusilla TaxID=64973 RepID=UPI000490033A|nr:hypothetical protein [Terasakiella pusilla]
MRFDDFNTDTETSRQKPFCWTITVQAKAMSRLSPFHLDKVTVSFPILNAAIANLRNLTLQGTDDCGQLICFTIDVALFADNEGQAMKLVQDPTLVDIVHEDGQLNLIEPEVTIGGESVLPEA